MSWLYSSAGGSFVRTSFVLSWPTRSATMQSTGEKTQVWVCLLDMACYFPRLKAWPEQESNVNGKTRTRSAPTPRVFTTAFGSYVEPTNTTLCCRLIKYTEGSSRIHFLTCTTCCTCGTLTFIACFDIHRQGIFRHQIIRRTVVIAKY